MAGTRRPVLTAANTGSALVHALARWARRVWRLHTATPTAIVLSLASLLVLAQSARSAVENLVWPAWGDIWNVVPDYQRWLDGRYGWADLIAPYAEHRIVLTRALLLLDAAVDRMNGHIPELAGLVSLAALGFLIWRMVRLDQPSGLRADTPPLFWIALMTSICQYENIDLPFQVQFPIACLSSGVAALLLTRATMVTRAQAALLAAGAGLAGIVAAFSLSSGVLLAPCLFVLLWLRRADRVVWAVFTPILILGVLLFFDGHTSTGESGPPLLDWQLTLLRIRYSCNFLASSLGAFPAFATWAGACGLLVLGFVCAALVGEFVARRKPVPAGDAALLSLCLTAVLCAPAGTLTARLNFGLSGALASRYATISLLFAATLLGLALRCVSRKRPGVLSSFAAPAAGLAGLMLANAPVYFHRAAAFKRVVLADAQLLANNVGIEGRISTIVFGTVRIVFGSADMARAGVAVMHAHELNIFDPDNGPPAVLLARLKGLKLSTLPACRGFVDAAYAVDSTAFLLSGWVTDQLGQHTAPWIAALDDTGQVLGTARPLTERADVQAALEMKETAYGFGDGFRLRTPGQPGAARTVHLLALFPGVWSPICELPALAQVGPLPIVPDTQLRDVASAKLMAASTLEGVMPMEAAKAWRLGPSPAGVAAWAFATLGHANAQARIVFHPAPIPAGRALAIPFSMADAASGRRVSVTMMDGANIEGTIQTTWHDEGWRAVVIPSDILTSHGGVKTIEVQVQGDTWLAIGAPVSANVLSEWSKLFR